jgi:hypothetical protein
MQPVYHHEGREKNMRDHPALWFVRVLFTVAFVLGIAAMSVGCACLGTECDSFCKEMDYAEGGRCVDSEHCICSVCCDTCETEHTYDLENCYRGCVDC